MIPSHSGTKVDVSLWPGPSLRNDIADNRLLKYHQTPHDEELEDSQNRLQATFSRQPRDSDFLKGSFLSHEPVFQKPAKLPGTQ